MKESQAYLDELKNVRKEAAASRQSVSTAFLVRDHEALLRRFCAYRDALDYCLAVLKHHHMSKRGISTLVKQIEQIKRKANAHALDEERSDDSQQRVVGGKVEA